MPGRDWLLAGGGWGAGERRAGEQRDRNQEPSTLHPPPSTLHPSPGAKNLGGRWKVEGGRSCPCSPASSTPAPVLPFLRREGTQTDITLYPESSPMKATREAITAAVAALEASRQ